MGNMKKIHPTVSEASLNILKSHGIKPAEAIEQYALLIATNETIVIQKEQMLEIKKQELVDEKKNLEKCITNVELELDNINELKRKYTPIQSKQFDTALHHITLRLRTIFESEEKNMWNLEKVSLNEIQMVCKENNVTVESVLKQIPPNLKRYIEGYTNR